MATVILELKKIKFVTVSTLSSSICIYRRRQWHPTSVLLPGKSHGRRSLIGCSPWGNYESDATERLHFHFSLSRIGEGNGNPLQCSCLENLRDGGACWAAVYGVAQSRIRLKRLSSSSSSSSDIKHVQPCGLERPHLAWRLVKLNMFGKISVIFFYLLVIWP